MRHIQEIIPLVLQTMLDNQQMGLELSDDDARYLKNGKVFRESNVLKLLREANEQKSFSPRRPEPNRNAHTKEQNPK